MSDKITKANTIAMLLCVGICVLKAGGQEAIHFDPFAAAPATEPGGKVHDSGPVIPQVDFSNNDITMAFQIISDATGWSIFPTGDVSKAKISLWAKNVSAQQLLDKVVTLAGFVYHRESDVITVMTYPEYMQYHGLEKRVFDLKFETADSVNVVLKPFLTQLGKNVVHKQTNTIILYESQANLKFIESVITKLDRPSDKVIIEVITLEYGDAEAIAKILQSVFSKQAEDLSNRSGSGQTPAENVDGTSVDLPGEAVQIHAITQANQLVVIGAAPDIERIRDLIALIDVYGENMMLEVIDLEYADSVMLADTLQQMFSNDRAAQTSRSNKNTSAQPNESQDTTAQSPISDAITSPRSEVIIEALGRTNQLLVKAYRADIERLRRFIDRLDHYVSPTTQNYPLTYIDASEIFDGLEEILNLDIADIRSEDSRDKSQGLTLVETTNSILLTGSPASHRIMASILETIDTPGIYETGMIKIYKLENADVDEVAQTITELLESYSEEDERTAPINLTQDSSAPAPGDAASDLTQSEGFAPQIEARVSVSKSTNSIVIQATGRQHRELEKLIKQLDTRRKQVLIEAMIVEVMTTDNLNVGVELGHASLDFIAFSAFGLSTKLDPTTGVRDITVSPGGTAAVLRPDKIAAIVHMLKQDGNARVASAPRILVNDNAVGFINSVAEEPTTETNQGETTTTTSFAGFVEAGTQFAITPHISEHDYLRIEYQITLNSFGTKPTDPSIPPPRNTTSIQSEATVPDGYSIVVGGLQMTSEIENVDKVPILGDIPILDWVFKNTSIEKQYKTTYLFITPRIIASTDFADLKQISDETLREMETNGVNDKLGIEGGQTSTSAWPKSTSQQK